MVPPADILLATLNAKFIHCAFGLRCLFANLGELQPRATLLEFEIQQRPLDIVEALLARRPRIVGLGVYIWNVRETTEVVATLKRVAPEIIVILGGPEVSYEWEAQEIVCLADHVITGEADLKFAEVCRRLLAPPPAPALNRDDAVRWGARGVSPAVFGVPPGTFPRGRASPFGSQLARRGPVGETPTGATGTVALPISTESFRLNPNPSPAADTGGAGLGSSLRAGADAPGATPFPKCIPADLPKLEELALPYELYTDADLAHRVLYVEASRGCPFTCEFCLSSLDIPVRQFPLEPFLAAMERLLARGATQFKFVDRTFNLNLMVSRAILQFFLARMRPGLFVHFEMVPDRLPEPLREVIAQFPAGSLQFEVGVQTFDELTSRNISRRQDHAKLAENLMWLRSHTGVHVHADLIVGLPGESLESFARGFDHLVALGPQEIQVGILKRLRGTPITRHDAEFAMRYSPQPPYELLGNRDLDFPTMQRLRRFARYWDLVANSGNFRTTAPLLWTSAGGSQREAAPFNSELSQHLLTSAAASPCWHFLAFSDWLYAHLGQRHGIALAALAEALFSYLTTKRSLSAEVAGRALLADFQAAGRRERPPFLQPFVSPVPPRGSSDAPHLTPKRQARHLDRKPA